MHNRVSMAIELLKSSDYNYNQRARIELAKLLNGNNHIEIENKKTLILKIYYLIYQFIYIILFKRLYHKNIKQ